MILTIESTVTTKRIGNKKMGDEPRKCPCNHTMQPASIQLTRKINNALFGKNPVKMAAKKHYYIRSINFGTLGSYARWIVEDFQKKYGKRALSKLMRKLVVVYFMNSPDDRLTRKKMLMNERNRKAETITQCSKRIHEIDDRLKEMGYNPEDII
jgi:hypothetical protein